MFIPRLGLLKPADDYEEQRDTFIHSIALLKRNALAAPFELAFKKQKELESSSTGQGDLMAIHYRDEEAIYIQAAHDRVTVIFSTVFREETDRIFGKVFLQVYLITLLIRPSTKEDHVGIRGCAPIASDTECAPGSLHKPEPSARNKRRPGSQRLGRHRLCDLCSLSAPLHQPQCCGWNHLAHPAVPQLPSLSYQMLKSVYAIPHASSRLRVPEGVEQVEDGSREYGKKDGDVRF